MYVAHGLRYTFVDVCVCLKFFLQTSYGYISGTGMSTPLSSVRFADRGLVSRGHGSDDMGTREFAGSQLRDTGIF